MLRIGSKKHLLALFSLILLCSSSVIAQVNRGGELVKAPAGSGEDIYVQTDKTSYLAGEIIWFRMFYMEEGTWKALDLSRVGYIELLDRNSRPVVQTKIEMGKRGGNGSLYIPLSLASDRYVLRAYTRWMRNTGADEYFEAPLTILNTVATVQQTVSDAQTPAIHFYPEGGQLLSGVTSILGFRVTDSRGLPADVSGVVTSPAGDTVANFSSFRYGIGKLQLNANPGVRYKAHFSIGENKYTGELPVASDRGYALHVSNSGASILATIRLQGLDLGAENMQLVIHNGKHTLAAQALVAMNNQSTEVKLDASKLQEGVNYITLFNQQKQPVCERLVFIRPQSTISIQANLNRESFGTRQQVELTVEPPTGIEAGDSVSYAVSVYQTSPWDDQWSAGIASQRWLLPALQGDVVAPEYYFSNDSGVDEATDNLMLTHGWRSFDQSKTKPATARKFVPELKGHIVLARVVRKADESPVANEVCYLSAPASPYDIEAARSDRQGYVTFEVDGFYGPGELVVKAGSDSAVHFRVDLLTPFSEEKLSKSYTTVKLDREWAKELQSRSVAMQANNIYRADSLRRFSAPAQNDTLPFYGRAEYTYRMDDYKRFTTMEEVFREFVAPITVSIRGGKHYLSVVDALYKQTYNENVMVLIDGVPLTDYNKIFSYDPLKVKRLDVVTRRYVLGSANVGGIVSFETYHGRFDAFELDPSVIMIDYEGLQLHREFYSPDYSVSNNPRIPDFRSTLLWQPNVLQSANDRVKLNFFTGDQKGRFQVLIEGVSDSGRVVRGVKEIVVE